MTNVLASVIDSLTLTNADQEYTYTLPANCAGYSLQCRTGVDIRIGTVTGKVAGPTDPYLTLKAGEAYNSPERAVFQAGTTLYFASSTAGAVVEIIYHTQIA